MQREPLWTTAIITAVIAALISLLTAFGVPITAAQQDAINQFMVVVAPIVVALIARAYVTPTAQPTDDTGEPLVRKVDGAQPVAKANQ